MDLYNKKRSEIATARIIELNNEKRSALMAVQISEINNEKPSIYHWGHGFESVHVWFFIVVMCIDEYLTMWIITLDKSVTSYFLCIGFI